MTSQDNEIEHSFHFDLAATQEPSTDDAASGDRMVTSSGGGRTNFAGIADELKAKENEKTANEAKASQGFEHSKKPSQQRQPLFNAGSGGVAKQTPTMQRTIQRYLQPGGSQQSSQQHRNPFAPSGNKPFKPSANGFGGPAPRPATSGRAHQAPAKGKLGGQLLATNPAAADRNRKGSLMGVAVLSQSQANASQALNASQRPVSAAAKPRKGDIAMIRSRVQSSPCVRNPFVDLDAETEAACQKVTFAGKRRPLSNYKWPLASCR